VDDYGYLWAGGAGGGLIKLDKNTGEYRVFNNPYSNSNGFNLMPVWEIVKLKTDELLIFNNSEVILLKIIHQVREDGSVFFDHRFSNYLQKGIEEILPMARQSYFITGFIDSKQDLWIGTDGAGAVKYSPRTGQYQYYNISNGMPSNAIKSILEDNYGNMWLATDKGFSRLDPVGETIDNVFYWSDSEYPDKEIDWWDGHRDNQGILYYGVMSDPVIMDPADFLNWEEEPKRIVFSDLRINNKSQRPWIDQTLSCLVNYPPDIHLDYTHHILTLNYAVLDYTHPGIYRYRYKLEGFDQDWIEAGTNTYLTYSNLPSGNYKLVVNFSDTNQFDVSNSASLNIYKSPALWNTWWAWLGYIVLVSGTGYFMIALIIKRNRIRKRLEKEHLELEKMKEIEEAKTRFFTQISHEVRTPLSLILQPVESLCRGEARGDESAFYSIIRRNALRLSELLDQMLDLSRLQSGRLRIKAGKHNIVEFVRLRVANFESLANSCGLKLKFESPLGDLDVYFDRDKMEKVINNLISNAIKFTPEAGNICVSVQKYEEKDGNEVGFISRSGENYLSGKEVVAIVVSDTGIGIPEDQQEKIFERFYRVRDNGEYEGMGIGLSLIRELVDLHHGSIRVESDQGEGSSFYVILPLGRSHFTEEEIVEEIQGEAGRKFQDIIPDVLRKIPDAIREHPGSGTGRDIEIVGNDIRMNHKKGKPIILFIEDNEDMRKYVKHTFESEYVFVGARDGIQGLEAAREHIPDIIVSDIMMPGIDGIEVCRRVKEDLRTRHIPVILLTAKAGREDRVEGLEIGADDYIAKPFDVRELKYRIRNQLNQLERLREKYVKAFLLNDPVAEITSRDDAFLTDLTEAIKRNLEDPSFSVSELSREMSISRSLLFRKLKALTGQQPNEFIRTIRLKKAAELLAGNSGNISEIAYAVGFNNISYFSRCFHKMYRMAPSEYVKRRAGTGQT
jgi:signal transduction histidine kinase/DNA-binding response OmpR family regulator